MYLNRHRNNNQFIFKLKFRKNKMSTRVIDETTRRVYFPRNPNAESLFPTAENSRSTLNSSIDQDMATSARGPPILSIAPSLSLPAMLRYYMTLFYYFILVELPDKSTSCNSDIFMEGYGTFPKGPEFAGVEGIMSKDILQ